MTFDRTCLEIDAEAVTGDLIRFLRQAVRDQLRRRGAVVAISGGIDSSVVLALCVRAFGADRVLGLMLPERESSPESLVLARRLAGRFGVETVVEDLSQALQGLGCYARRDAAIRSVLPEYGPDHTAKISLAPNVLENDTLNLFHVTIVSPTGEQRSTRAGFRALMQIVAASNMKQRCRMAMTYYHAERRNFAVVGTPNRDEHEQGFFVKWGDGAHDIAPLRHLYKTQVYRLAEHLGIPDEIRAAVPTSDTYSAPSSQQEFFFRLPFELMDLIAWAADHGVPAAEVAAALDLTEQQVRRALADLERKRRTTEYLRTPPLGLDSGWRPPGAADGAAPGPALSRPDQQHSGAHEGHSVG